MPWHSESRPLPRPPDPNDTGEGLDDWHPGQPFAHWPEPWCHPFETEMADIWDHVDAASRRMFGLDYGDLETDFQRGKITLGHLPAALLIFGNDPVTMDTSIRGGPWDYVRTEI